ncbi:MAG: sigma-70 family RNA polymerase sigma factor [Actinobacteria bacterium]|nr:sigma-70 family RNA polymerase sigma factor [Actinomycetota bacterium]
MATAGAVGRRRTAGATGDVAEETHESSFRRFYDAEFRSTYALLLARTGDRWVAEELLQEAFARAYRDWDRVGRYERPAAWLRTVAANLAASRFRRLGAEARAMLRLRGMRHDAASVASEHDDVVWAEVRRLPNRQAEALILHYVHDLPISELAAAMSCAEGTAKAHLHRGRRALARRLQVELSSPEEDAR